MFLSVDSNAMFSVYFICVCILRQKKIFPSDLNLHCRSVALLANIISFALFIRSIVDFIRYSKFELIALPTKCNSNYSPHLIRCLVFSSFSVSSSRGVSLVLLLDDKVQFIVMTIDNEIASIYFTNKFRCSDDVFDFRGCHTLPHVS